MVRGSRAESRQLALAPLLAPETNFVGVLVREYNSSDNFGWS
jgi:hypothetical protein